MAERVAIVGGEALTALGEDLERTRVALAEGRRAPAAWPEAGAWDGRPPWVALVPGARAVPVEDPVLRLLGAHGERMEIVARRAHQAARLEQLERLDVGLFAAVGMVDGAPEELAGAVLASRGPGGGLDLARFWQGGLRSLHPLWPLSMLASVAVGQVATSLDLRGDNDILASGPDAGLRAVGEALHSLRAGRARAALVCAASEAVTEVTLLRLDLLGRLARGPGAPAAGRVVPGEGAAALALESEASARARGARVLGWLTGHALAFACDPQRPEAAWEEARDAALAQSGRRASDAPDATVDVAAAVGSLGAAAPLLDVLLALDTLDAGCALVTASSGEGAVGVLVVEGP